MKPLEVGVDDVDAMAPEQLGQYKILTSGHSLGATGVESYGQGAHTIGLHLQR